MCLRVNVFISSECAHKIICFFLICQLLRRFFFKNMPYRCSIYNIIRYKLLTDIKYKNFFAETFAQFNIKHYFCTRFKKPSYSHPTELERWQSGRMHRSWKPAYWEVPGVRIPLSPQQSPVNRKIYRTFLFFVLLSSPH